MSTYNELADYEWLTGDEAAALVAELLHDLTIGRESLPATLRRLRKRLSPAQTHLVIELLELRQRAAAKFTAADRMFFTRIGLQQATDQWVAAYKATRFAQRAGASPIPLERAGSSPTPAIADLCCGIGGDLLALAEQGSVVGVDCDPIATHFAAANARAVLTSDCADQVSLRTIDAEQFDLDGFAAWHIDPDRRPTGHRTTSLDWCRPDRVAVERLLAQVPHAAIKLAPASKVPAEWAKRCELEWISRDRQCRQLVAWHGQLARAPGQRRATIVSAARGLASRVVPDHGTSPRTLTGAPNQPVPIVEKLHRYIFDIDPAVLAAHLTGALAAEHGLSALAPGPTYLTGAAPITDAALSCFEVDEVLPLRTRYLARHLRDRSIGQLEIKKRGIDIVPEQLRRDLKLHGDQAAMLLITRVAARPTAILARRD